MTTPAPSPQRICASCNNNLFPWCDLHQKGYCVHKCDACAILPDPARCVAAARQGMVALTDLVQQCDVGYFDAEDGEKQEAIFMASLDHAKAALAAWQEASK